MLGLALQGGGAKGAFQAGAIKALMEEGYKFDGVVGTSIGALNGALIAQGDFEKTYELWYNLEISQLFDIDDKVAENISNLTIDTDTIRYVYRKIKEIINQRGLDRARGRELIGKYLNEDKLRSSITDFGMVTIEKGEKYNPLMLFKEDIPYGMLVDYIIASGNLPIFNDLMVGDKKLYDGGLYDNLPINMLINKGYKDIVAIRLGSTMAPVKEVRDQSVTITYIDPSEKPGSLLNFTNKSIRRAITLGYFDTKRIIKGYIGSKYYVIPIGDNEFYCFINRLPLSFYEECANILGISAHFESDRDYSLIISEIKKLMKLDKNTTDLECALNFVEAFAEYSKIERFKVYAFGELLDKTITSYAKTMDSDNHKYNRRVEKLKAVFDLFVKTQRK